MIYYSERKSYYKSLLDLCKGIEFIEHKQYLEKVIESCDKQIIRKKKIDFMRD